MIRIITLLAAVALLPHAAIAQSNAGQAADAAETVATRATGTFEAIDPDSEMSADDDAAAVYAGLPQLDVSAPVVAPSMAVEPEAMRGPAARMISQEVVQPLPAATAPVAVAAPAPIAALASRDPFVIKSILPIEGSIRYGDWFWDESAAPRSGTLVITIDLEARVISAFRDGHEIGTAVALLGTQAHPTPVGTFPILTKEKDNVSEKYNNAPMPWTLRLTWDGIAIHGSPVMNGYASHGCIGVPDEFAAKLFAAAKRGDKVIVTRGKMVGIGDKVL
ncbi:MAG: L,D-transpeptidase [Sphingomonadales bacterium]|nr:MAG: L,D-transpeptidase [Sphingomonadales bacterium]